MPPINEGQSKSKLNLFIYYLLLSALFIFYYLYSVICFFLFFFCFIRFQFILSQQTNKRRRRSIIIIILIRSADEIRLHHKALKNPKKNRNGRIAAVDDRLSQSTDLTLRFPQHLATIKYYFSIRDMDPSISVMSFFQGIEMEIKMETP